MAAFLKFLKKKTNTLPKVQDLSGPQKVKVGFPSSKSSKSNIEKAIWNEFGTRGRSPRRGGWGGPIPERPFMRNAMRNNVGKYKAALKASASKVLLGQTDLQVVLTKLGRLAQGDIRHEIIAMRDPPNAELTIKLKGSDAPLRDTGAMQQAVTWVVED